MPTAADAGGRALDHHDDEYLDEERPWTDGCPVGVLLVGLLVVVLCAPALAGHALPGSAAPAAVVRARPLPGSCLAPLATPDQLNTVVDVVPSVPCSRPHSAEVLSVQPLDATVRSRPDVSDVQQTAGTVARQCDQLAGRYLGWGTRSADHRIPVSFYTRLTVPDDLQWQVGQRWYACELLPGVLDFPITSLGSARNASIGTPPGAFGRCSDDPGQPPVSCTRPHHAEQLTQDFSPISAATTPCPVLAARVIGAADPTFAGQLAVLTRRSGGATGCWVTTTSSRSLTDTLIHHGTGPLPLTG